MKKKFKILVFVTLMIALITILTIVINGTIKGDIDWPSWSQIKQSILDAFGSPAH